MASKDYYKILGVSRTAGKDELKKAFRRLAMKYHPDRNTDDPDAAEKFKEAKEAYEVLSNPELKAAYDQGGEEGVQYRRQAGGAGSGNFDDVFKEFFGEGFFDDIFGGRGGFGGAGGQPQRQRGADLRYTLEIPLEEAIFGDNVEIEVPTNVTCKTCDGSGAKAGTSPTKCTSCGGVGQVRMQQGIFAIQQTCPTCRGSGQMIKDPCQKCHGQGLVHERKTLSVKVPPGVDSGDRMRLAGEGEAGAHGGPAGDLYVVISVLPHEIFKRDHNDLMCDVPVDYALATMGGELDVPTLDGRVKLKIPAGSQSGKLFRLRGKGVKPVRGGPTGDLLCRVVVETPVKLSRSQKDLLRQLQESFKSDDSHHPKARTWQQKMKAFFTERKHQ